jgi:hypothetical protein
VKAETERRDLNDEEKQKKENAARPRAERDQRQTPDKIDPVRLSDRKEIGLAQEKKIEQKSIRAVQGQNDVGQRDVVTRLGRIEISDKQHGKSQNGSHFADERNIHALEDGSFFVRRFHSLSQYPLSSKNLSKAALIFNASVGGKPDRKREIHFAEKSLNTNGI